MPSIPCSPPIGGGPAAYLELTAGSNEDTAQMRGHVATMSRGRSILKMKECRRRCCTIPRLGSPYGLITWRTTVDGHMQRVRPLSPGFEFESIMDPTTKP